jgi:hypothetical protein
MPSNCEDLYDTDLYQSAVSRIDDLATALIDGGISIEDWQNAMVAELKRLHTQAAASGAGAWGDMSQADWGKVGSTLKREYAWLRDFAKAIQDGLTEAQIRARAKQYANHINLPCWESQTRHSEATHMSRHLNPAEHCDDCVGYAAQDKQPIGTLPMPGDGSQCRSNCKCTVRYWAEVRQISPAGLDIRWFEEVFV